MQNKDRFPYEASRWSAGQPDQAKRWFDELEIIGVHNVRARLAQVNAGSGGSVPIGATQMTIGFAQEWLAWYDQKREALEAQRHNREVFWTRFAALAATVAAAAAVFGVLWTIFHKAAP